MQQNGCYWLKYKKNVHFKCIIFITPPKVVYYAVFNLHYLVHLKTLCFIFSSHF